MLCACWDRSLLVLGRNLEALAEEDDEEEMEEHQEKDVSTARFMVGPGHCSMISKIWPIIFQSSWPSVPILLSCEKSHFNKKYPSYSESTNSIKQKLHVGRQYN